MQSAFNLPWQQPKASEFVAAQALVATAWIDRARRGCRPELPPPASTSGPWSIWSSSSGPASQTCAGAMPPRACHISPPSQRPLLYSFQGAYAPGLYLTTVRDLLAAAAQPLSSAAAAFGVDSAQRHRPPGAAQAPLAISPPSMQAAAQGGLRGGGWQRERAHRRPLALAYYLLIGLLLPAAGAASASAVPSLGPDSPGDALYLRAISGLQVD